MGPASLLSLKVKIGVLAANTGPFAAPEGAVALATGAEAAGMESLWTAEHALWPDDYQSAYPYAETEKMPGAPDTPLPDPFIWLAWCAAHSDTLRLATGIAIVPHRHPAMMAKEVATLDYLSHGRVVLGSLASGGYGRSSTRSGCRSRVGGAAPRNTST